MRNQLKIVYSALSLVAMLGLTSSVHGIPAFARQTGLDCNSCHAPIGFPVLNAFGQAFRAGGMTQASEDTLMGDGEALSLPKNLNAAVVAKMRAHFGTKTAIGAYDPAGTSPNSKTTFTATDKNGVATNGTVDYSKTTSVGYNRLDMPDEWAIWLGGRVGKHIGFDVEIGANPGSSLALEVLSFKAPIVYDVGPLKVGAVPYWTDAQGPGWGFETLSTGAVGNVKMFEGGPAQSARMYLENEGITGTNKGKALGLGIYVWHPMGFVYYSAFNNNGGQNDIFNPILAHYIRVAITPSFAGIDTAVGFQYITGNTGLRGEPIQDGVNGGGSTKVLRDPGAYGILTRTNYLGFDAQVMGTFGLPMMLVFTFGMADNTLDQYGDPVQGSNVYKASAWSVLYNITLIEDLLNVGVGVRMATFDEYKNCNAVAKSGQASATTYDCSAADVTPKEPGAAKKGALARTTYLDKKSLNYATNGSYVDNQLIGEIKFNLSRNLRLSVTGYKQLGTPDVLDSDGTLKQTQKNNVKDDKLTVMLFGGF